jgi:hypothetical protein
MYFTTFEEPAADDGDDMGAFKWADERRAMRQMRSYQLTSARTLIIASWTYADEHCTAVSAAACMQAAYRSLRRGYVSTYELQDPRGAPTRFLEHRML